MFKPRQRTRGQALVEFALAATLIFFLLSAAIDLGLIFFRHQGLYNASLEGASFGSRFVKTYTLSDPDVPVDRVRLGCDIPGATQFVCIDEKEVLKRVTNEDGGGLSMINFKDLNADGIPDDPDVQKEYITIRAVRDEQNPGAPCPNITNPPGNTPYCYIYVGLKSNYHMFFLLAPAFGDSVNVSASTFYPIRAQIQTNSNATPGLIASDTPTKTPTSSATPTATNTATTPPGTGPSPGTGSTGTTIPPDQTQITSGSPSAEGTPGPGGTTGVVNTPTRTPTKTRVPTKTYTPGPSPTRTRTKTPGPSPTRKPTTPKPTAKPTSKSTKVPGSTPKPTIIRATPTNEGT